MGGLHHSRLCTVVSRCCCHSRILSSCMCWRVCVTFTTLGLEEYVGVEELRREKPSKHPLADYQLPLADARFTWKEEVADTTLVSLTAGGQRAFKDILMPFLKRVDRNTKGIAERLFPFTRLEHRSSPSTAPRVVVIDPMIAFGKPVLVNSRISTAFLLSRKRGGASIPRLAADYGRSEEEIAEAINLEEAA